MPKDSEGSTGSSYIVDRKNRKVLIPIDVNKIGDVKELLGTLTEEVAHGKDALEGRQDKKVAEDKSNDEEGLESLGRPANEYVKKKFGEDNNSKIKLTTDGIDLSNADVGEKVGDVNTQDDKNSGYAETLPSQQRDPWLNKMNFKLLRLRKNTDEFLEKTLISSFYFQMRAYSILSDSGETIRDFTLGALKAGGEDLSLNTYKIPKRFQYNTLAYKNGELFGHFTMSVIGILGTIIGSGMEGGGIAAAPATGGVSLEVTAGGVVVETYSAGVGATASTNLAKTSLEIKAMKSEGGSSDNNSNKSIEDTKNLEKELEELKLVRRPEVVERIKIARSYGDLSENSEYEAAKDEQAFVEGQISSLETKIRYAEIVNSDAVAKDEVAIGKTVTIQEVGESEEEVYIIVGSAGADAFAGKISNESPIGQALIGKKIGDTATVETPVGNYDVKILKVEKTV
mgnify:CR=1 FL=1